MTQPYRAPSWDRSFPEPTGGLTNLLTDLKVHGTLFVGDAEFSVGSYLLLDGTVPMEGQVRLVDQTGASGEAPTSTQATSRAYVESLITAAVPGLTTEGGSASAGSIPILNEFGVLGDSLFPSELPGAVELSETATAPNVRTPVSETTGLFAVGEEVHYTKDGVDQGEVFAGPLPDFSNQGIVFRQDVSQTFGAPIAAGAADSFTVPVADYDDADHEAFYYSNTENVVTSVSLDGTQATIDVRNVTTGNTTVVDGRLIIYKAPTLGAKEAKGTASIGSVGVSNIGITLNYLDTFDVLTSTIGSVGGAEAAPTVVVN